MIKILIQAIKPRLLVPDLLTIDHKLHPIDEWISKLIRFLAIAELFYRIPSQFQIVLIDLNSFTVNCNLPSPKPDRKKNLTDFKQKIFPFKT